MGHRANFIVIQNGITSCYTDRWSAINIPNLTFWGPEWTLQHLQTLSEVPPEHLRDSLWCEGAILLNLDTHTLIFHFEYWSVEGPAVVQGHQVFDYDTFPACVVLRTCYLEMLQLGWEGWQVVFARTVDFACPVTLEMDPEQVPAFEAATPAERQAFPLAAEQVYLKFAELLLLDQRFDFRKVARSILQHHSQVQVAEDFFDVPPSLLPPSFKQLHMQKVLRQLLP